MIWYEMTYPFPNFNVEVGEWISNFIPHHVWTSLLTHAGLKLIQVNKRPLDATRNAVYYVRLGPIFIKYNSSLTHRPIHKGGLIKHVVVYIYKWTGYDAQTTFEWKGFPRKSILMLISGHPGHYKTCCDKMIWSRSSICLTWHYIIYFEVILF